MFKKALLATFAVLALCIVGVLAIAATKPDTFRVARSITIKAPPEQVYPLINDLRANTKWSPFEKDPEMKRTFSVVSSGKGATYAWDGNMDVGAGEIAITEATPPSKVIMNLSMVRPMEGQNTVEFDLAPAAGGNTEVTWVIHGEQPFLGKIVSVFLDCEAMIGPEFEKGLAKLKAVAENETASIAQ